MKTPQKIEYTVTRVPVNDWNNLMETVSLDGSYSQEIKDEVWTAMDNMQDFSNPWVVIEITNGETTARIFPDEKSARRANARRTKSSRNAPTYVAPARYQGWEGS